MLWFATQAYLRFLFHVRPRQPLSCPFSYIPCLRFECVHVTLYLPPSTPRRCRLNVQTAAESGKSGEIEIEKPALASADISGGADCGGCSGSGSGGDIGFEDESPDFAPDFGLDVDPVVDHRLAGSAAGESDMPSPSQAPAPVQASGKTSDRAAAGGGAGTGADVPAAERGSRDAYSSQKISSACVAFSAALSATPSPPPSPPPSSAVAKSGEGPAVDQTSSNAGAACATADRLPESFREASSGEANEFGIRAGAFPVSEAGEGVSSRETTRDSMEAAAASKTNPSAASALPVPTFPAADIHIARAPDRPADKPADKPARGTVSSSEGPGVSGCVTGGEETGATATAAAAGAKDAPSLCVARSILKDSKAGESCSAADSTVVADTGGARDDEVAAATATKVPDSTSAAAGEAGLKSSAYAAENARSQTNWVGPVEVALGSSGNRPSGIHNAPPPAAVSASVPAPPTSVTISNKASDGTSASGSVDVGSVEGPTDDRVGLVAVSGDSPKCAAAASKPSEREKGLPAVNSAPVVDGARQGGATIDVGTRKASEAAQVAIGAEPATTTAVATAAAPPRAEAPSAPAPTATAAAASDASAGQQVLSSPAGAAATPAPASGPQTRSAVAPSPKAGASANKKQRGKEKTTCLFLHVIGPAPTEEKVRHVSP